MFYEPRASKDQKWDSYLICDWKWHVNTLKKNLGINYSYNLTPILLSLHFYSTLFAWYILWLQISKTKIWNFYIIGATNTFFSYFITQNLVFPDGFNYPIHPDTTVKRTEVSNLSWVLLSSILIHQKWFQANLSSESDTLA